MVSAPASTTPNSLKNVSISCSERKTKKLRLCFPEDRQKVQSCEKDCEDRWSPCPRKQQTRVQTQISQPIKEICGKPGTELQQSSSAHQEYVYMTVKGVTEACLAKPEPALQLPTRGQSVVEPQHRAQCSSVLQCLLRWVHFVTHTSHQNSWITTSSWATNPNLTQPCVNRLQSPLWHHCGHNLYGSKQAGRYAITN